eukprot:5789569-Pyramimonas_sp.AAC.1
MGNHEELIQCSMCMLAVLAGLNEDVELDIGSPFAKRPTPMRHSIPEAGASNNPRPHHHHHQHHHHHHHYHHRRRHL